MLPNLVIIGARKCGTTSLHHYLSFHPEIYMSRQKELGLFGRANWQDRLDWYEAQFPEATPIRGEATPHYSTYPRPHSVPERMHELIPEAKLIYVVGDPMKRIVAQWVQWYAAEMDLNPLDEPARMAGKPLDVVLRTWNDPANPYVAPSLYATQIERYLRVFPEAQIRVVDQNYLKGRRVDALQDVFAFLGVDRAFVSPEFSVELNLGWEKRRYRPRYSRARRTLLRLGAERMPRTIRRPVGARLGRALSLRVDRPPIPQHIEAGLAELLHEEADRLRSLTGMSFSSWSV